MKIKLKARNEFQSNLNCAICILAFLYHKKFECLHLNDMIYVIYKHLYMYRMYCLPRAL